jgi:hypothetical protein
MAKVTGLSPDEVQTLNNTLNALLTKGMDKLEERVDSKTERTVFKAVHMAVKMAGHLSPERKLGTLVEGTNKLLPKISEIFDEEAVLNLLPPEVKTAQIADLCEKAGAGPLSKLLRDSLPAIAAPVTATVTAAASDVPNK